MRYGGRGAAGARTSPTDRPRIHENARPHLDRSLSNDADLRDWLPVPRLNPRSAGPRRRLAAVCVTITALVLAAGCAAGPVAADARSSPAREVTPLTVDALRAILAASAEENLVPGAFAQVTTPDGTVAAAYGTTVRGQSRTPQSSDVFRIGSVTKTMVGIAVLQLAGEGRLALTDPIERFVPGIPNGTTITIADLLQMRSGLHNYLDTDGFADVFDHDMTAIWTPEALVALGVGMPAGSAPGTAFDYSNTNTALLGMVAEELDGKPLAGILHDRLFAPLGMSDTVLPAATDLALPSPDVQGYQYGVFPINNRPLLSAQEQDAARAGELDPAVVTAQSPAWSWAAGGVVSTADDLAIWARALGSGELLSEAMHQAWRTDLHPMDPARPDDGPQYGLGIEQTRFGANRLYLHEGELPGFNTFVATDPANEVTIVIWTNLALSLDGHATAKAIAGELIGSLYATPLGSPIIPEPGE